MLRSYLTKRTSDADFLQTFTPLEVASIYGIPLESKGKKQRIAIIELGGGYTMSQMEVYLSHLKIKDRPTIQDVLIGSAKNNPADRAGSEEVALDLQIIASLAPLSEITVYFAENTFSGFYEAVCAAIRENNHFVSISWGAPECTWGAANLQKCNVIFQRAALRGINIFCASGDLGSPNGLPGTDNVDFPASSPHVISCGGTTLQYKAQIKTEHAWNNTGGATGGGFSRVFPRPVYQSSSVDSNFRGVPDVCGNADPKTGYMIYIGSAFYVMGGTSAVSPLWTAACALVQSSGVGTLGSLFTKLYTIKPVCDVISGSNGEYNADRGWDPCTGLGSPNGMLLHKLATPMAINTLRPSRDNRVHGRPFVRVGAPTSLKRPFRARKR